MKVKILIALLIGGTLFAMITDDPPDDERTSSSSSSDSTTEESEESESDLPQISDEAVSMTEINVEENEPVGDAHIALEDDDVTIALVLKSTTSESDAKRLLENAARLLATTASVDNPELSGATKDGLGDLWDHYTLSLVAGTGTDNVLVEGAKIKGARSITW